MRMLNWEYKDENAIVGSTLGLNYLAVCRRLCLGSFLGAYAVGALMRDVIWLFTGVVSGAVLAWCLAVEVMIK